MATICNIPSDETVNMRNAPKNDGSTVVRTRVGFGKTVTLTGNTATDDRGQSWTECEFGAWTGWIMSDFIC